MSGRILVVDDKASTFDISVKLHTTGGYEVITAESGEECLALTELEKPSLVLLDYMMPGMAGMTILRELHRRFPDTYVIMLIDKGNERIADEVMKADAAAYIFKPFSNQDLIDRIEIVLRIRRIEIHNRELRLERERLLNEIKGWNSELERRVVEKTLELERAHAKNFQAEKPGTLGSLAAGLVHEIRNPLNAIGLFAQILKPVLADDPERAGYMDKLLGEVDRIDDILSQFLVSSKQL